MCFQKEITYPAYNLIVTKTHCYFISQTTALEWELKPTLEKQTTIRLTTISQKGRQIKKKHLLFCLTLSVFLKWEVSLLDWIKMADLSAQRPLSTQLWRALLFQSSAPHCCWDQSTPVKASLWWKRSRIKTRMEVARFQARRHSRARSECCWTSCLCLGLAVTSSLCLCCRWCVSSLGYPSFCWRGTSPLFPLPEKKYRKSSSQHYMKT